MNIDIKEMNNFNSFPLPKSTKSNLTRQEFWNGTLVDDYNFLMSEELIYHCKSSLGEPFCSLNDLTVHHVSYNEFEKQYIELSDWCEKTSQIIKQISSNILTCYLRQKSYEDLYEQGLMRLRMFNQYTNKLIERFPDLKIVINEKREKIYRIWNELEGHFIRYLDEDFDRIIEELHKELFLFEEWIINIEEQLEKFQFIRNENILLDDCQQVIKLQNEIKSKNSSVSSVIEICERLKNDYKQEINQIPFDYATDLENRWHQIWIYSLEIQCKIEERIKFSKHSNSFSLINENEEDDIIPFNSSEYEKISLTSSNNSDINTYLLNRKRPRSPIILNRQMAKSKRRMSLNILPKLSPSIFYYSLTNINDYDESIIIKKQKRTCSKLDIGYASEDDFDKKPIYSIKKSQSDFNIHLKPISNILSSHTHSLPLFEHHEWWRHSITSAYDTCSNPDIDLSIEESKKTSIKPSLLIYSKKYTKMKQKSSLISNSYDASVEYTDAEQSENDVDILSSSSSSPINGESLFYNRYTTTTTTTKEYSSDIEHETIPEQENKKTENLNEISSINSEPCWDGYQNPLFYPLNSQDIDSIETTLKWDDQFFEMDQPCYSTSDDELHIHENFNRFLRTNNGSSSSSSLITSVINKQQFDSDSDLDDFNYVINETERQLLKTRQSLEKKKRQQQQFTSIINDRNQRKYDEILRTCQTNIQCLQQILKNLHRSNNSRLYSTRAIELLQTYLSDWNDMQQQIIDERTRSRHLLHISQEIIKLKLRLDEELSHINTTFHSSWFENHSLNELKHRIYYEFELEKENRQKINLFHTDIHLADEHLKEYRMTYPDGPSSFNIDEHLHSSRFILNQLTTKMDSYQIQLRTLLTMIDNLLPIENHIEQKLTSLDYNIDLQELQTLIDNYERMIPINNFYDILKNHCQYKLNFYRKMLNDLIHKHDKHVSFDSSINFNNNNSTTINSSTTTSSSNSSTPQQHYTHENFQSKKNLFNKYRQTEIRDMQENFTTKESFNKQSSTSSYISDDCKVLYIETVIEVDKPVFYERLTDTSSSTNTEYHHHHHHIPQHIINTQQTSTSNTNKYLMDNTNNNHSADSSTDDDELPDNNINPVHYSTTSNHNNSNNEYSEQQDDTAIELDQNSISSTIYNQEPSKSRLLFPPTDQAFEETSQPTIIRRIQQQKTLNNTNRDELSIRRPVIPFKRSNTWFNLLQKYWLRLILFILFVLLIIFFVYLYRLDRCIRSTMILSICHNIIHIESGLPIL